MPLPQALTGDTWAVKTAVAMLPLLVRYAKRGETVTYGGLDLEIQRRGLGHHVHAAAYGWPAGAVGNALVETGSEWGIRIPPLNALVVNGQTGIPSSGCDWYLLHVLGKPQQELTEDDRRALAKAVQEMVFHFDRWDELLTEYGLRPIPVGNVRHRTPRATGKRRNWSGEGEGEAHRKLVAYVAAHPALLGVTWAHRKGNCKYWFLSGDRPDVVFRTFHGFLAVEVKPHTSTNEDLVRGVYQCVKYRALARAEQVANREIPNASVMLVVGRTVPSAVMRLADLHGIRTVVVER